MKTAISVPDATFARVEVAASRLGVSRSEFFSRAAERWIAELADRETTEAIDAVIGGLVDGAGDAPAAPDADAPFRTEAARRTFAAGDPW